ncbi:hypothetical protein JHN61_04515 [Streptomyces sp. MBT67]|uniref:hypothetical protein n=1 Tax=unclassified Streptomyces TaxID=2593676 RepID=UPI00190BEEBF|nr:MULTISPECIES: hypothetical protein [unclassified Streptomyces]MBK3531065.1 hypothetical protein [Streptomyces sp. MBT72]MBK3535496.1 hypothetical protein [Streptomyces sp. MBT67]MBK3552929.1 hypothetical protein [Streptomyces sp. MBT61]MBK6032161.1 hypothetical protein [Streptomyces sp. MBT59]
MADTPDANARRLRRLTEMGKAKAVERASRALRDVWEAGRKPSEIVLRVELIQRLDGERAPLVRLVLPRGIALRFYLVALFEAQCRLGVNEPWVNDRPLTGVGSWSDFFAIDGAYDSESKTYMPDTKQGRTVADLRLRQVKSALDTLEKLGPEHALAVVPKAKNGGRRQYGQFSLMKEMGRGGHLTPDTYTVPGAHWSARTISIPADFFLMGWVQVLNPSEVATWLTLRALSQWARGQHAETGVYLYGKARKEDFGLRRDAWEGGCSMLRSLGLLRHARSSPLDATPKKGLFPDLDLWDYFARTTRERYEPYRWQVIDQRLGEDAMKTFLKELTLRQQQLDRAAEHRAQKKNSSTA